MRHTRRLDELSVEYKRNPDRLKLVDYILAEDVKDDLTTLAEKIKRALEVYKASAVYQHYLRHII